MQYALTSPVLGSIALAGLVLGLGVVAPSSPPEPVTHQLRLHAVDKPGAIYATVFRHGDLRVRFDGDAIHPVKFKVRATTPDGCRWLAIETLIPRDPRSFDYDYKERMLGCPPDTEPMYIPTPRKGLVTIED